MKKRFFSASLAHGLFQLHLASFTEAFGKLPNLRLPETAK
jgi:hypothetical protein